MDNDGCEIAPESELESSELELELELELDEAKDSQDPAKV